MVAAAGVGALPVADLAGMSRKRISGGHRDGAVDINEQNPPCPRNIDLYFSSAIIMQASRMHVAAATPVEVL